VYAGSGYLAGRRAQKHQDWALIEIREQRGLPGKRNKIPERPKPDWKGIFYEPKYKTIKGVTDLEKGMHLFKVSHEIGFGRGILNGIEEADV
jgi:hypothetical protein